VGMRGMLMCDGWKLQWTFKFDCLHRGERHHTSLVLQALAHALAQKYHNDDDLGRSVVKIPGVAAPWSLDAGPSTEGGQLERRKKHPKNIPENARETR
jgi:hypothetical protein